MTKRDDLEELVARAKSLSQRARAEFLRELRERDEELARQLEERLMPPSDGSSTPASNAIRRLAETTPESSRYELRGEIARGGMGAIIKVWDTTLRRTLAMKVALGRDGAGEPRSTPLVDERTLGRFLDEAQVTGQLDHPGIVPVHELGVDDDGNVYFTMRLVKGETLEDVFAKAREGLDRWTQARVLGVLLKVCEAMSYAHAKGVLHRDLKPSNVMVGRYGEVYVMDWGLARVLGKEDPKDIRLQASATSTRTLHTDLRDAPSDSPLLTMDGDVVGTPAYMSPEQARGDLDAMGPHSDVYSIGAILYHYLAGHMPYAPPGKRVNAYAIWSHLQEEPPAPLGAECPAGLVAICEKAMARDVRDRYRAVDQLERDLERYLGRGLTEARRSLKRSASLGVLQFLLTAALWLATGLTAVSLLVGLVGLGAVGDLGSFGTVEGGTIVAVPIDILGNDFHVHSNDPSVRVDALEGLRGTVHVSADRGPVRWLSLLGYPLAVVLLLALKKFRDAVRSAGAGSPFAAANSRRIAFVGWTFLALGLTTIVWPIALSLLLEDALTMEKARISTFFDLSHVVAGLAILALAAVFRVGAELDSGDPEEPFETAPTVAPTKGRVDDSTVVDVIVPPGDLGLASARVTAWSVALRETVVEGEEIALLDLGEPVSVHAPCDGTIVWIAAADGESIGVGATLCQIRPLES